MDKQEVMRNGNYPNFFGIDEEETPNNDEKAKTNGKNKKKSLKNNGYKK